MSGRAHAAVVDRPDGLSSTMAVVDASGVVQDSYTYDVYGKPTKTGTLSNEFDFAGQQTDGTGLQYLRARYYDPATGTFLSREPLADLATWMGSSSGYGGGSPARFRDPSGLVLVDADTGGTNWCVRTQCEASYSSGDLAGDGGIAWGAALSKASYVGNPQAWAADVLLIAKELGVSGASAPYWVFSVLSIAQYIQHGDFIAAAVTFGAMWFGAKWIIPAILVNDLLHPTPAGDPCDYDAVNERCREDTLIGEYPTAQTNMSPGGGGGW